MKNQTGKYIRSLFPYYQEALQSERLTREEESTLLEEIQKGNKKAEQKFFLCNIKLVISIASKLTYEEETLKDLVQEGSIALLKAMHHFKVETGIRFSTYAVPCIRGELLTLFSKMTTNFLFPHHIIVQINQCRKAQVQLEIAYGRPPTTEELAQFLEITVEETKTLLLWGRSMISLNAFSKEEESESFYIDTLVSSDDVEQQAMVHSMQEEVWHLLEECNLTEIQKEALCIRHDINRGEDSFKIVNNCSAVSQYSKRAIEKIRCSSSIIEIADYMDFPEKATQRIYQFRKNR